MKSNNTGITIKLVFYFLFFSRITIYVTVILPT